MLRVLTIAWLLAFACSCAQERPTATAHANGREAVLFVTPRISGESNEIRVTARGTGSDRIDAIAIGMPEMGMPPERIELTRARDGSYTAANVRFSMAGTWHVAILERDATGTREFASFDITVR